MPDPADLANAQRALLLTAALLRVQEAFDAAGIPFLAFKGPTLSLSLYGSLGARTFGDIDVILPAHRVVEARRLMAGMGYTPHIDVTDEQLAWLTTFLNEYAMLGKGSMVELHWSVVRPGYRFSLSYEDLAPYKTTLAVADRSVPTLRAEAMVVVLAVHGAKHGWSRRSWLTDFADLALGKRAPDWDEVFAIAAQHRATRFVLQAAWLARHELHRSLPEQLEQRLARDRMAGVAARMARRSPQEGVRSYLSYVVAMSDVRSRFRAFEELFVDPTPLDCQLVDLPKRLFPLYHAVRPIRLFGKHLLGRGRP